MPVDPMLPSDFPRADFEATCDVAGAVYARGVAVPNPGPEVEQWKQFASAELAVQSRWRALAEADETYTEAVRNPRGDQEGRRLEDAAIFKFFTNALSVVETAGFQLYALAGIFDPDTFTLTIANPRAVTFARVCEAFDKLHPAEAVSRSLNALATDERYSTIKAVRDILSHRGQPPRNFLPEPPAAIPPGGVHLQAPFVRQPPRSAGLVLDDQMTARFRAVLANHFAAIYSEAREFAARREAPAA